MRRSALALCLAAVLALPAHADGPRTQSSVVLIAPTAPVTTNNNQIATTAWVNNFSTIIRASQFGAKCDGATDDTIAIQNAGNQAIALGVPLYIDPSVNGCIVSQNGSNSYALLWSSPIKIYGTPGRSIIRPAAGMASTVSIFYFQGSANTYQRTVVDGIFIGNPSSGTRPGLHGIVFDTLNAGAGFYHPQITNNYIQQSTSGTGWSIFAINSQANNPTGGLVYPEFKDNFFGSGASFNKSGDSIRLTHNVFTGTSSNPGIYLDLVNGSGGLAGNTVIDGANNFSTAAGAVVVDCAQAPLIAQNEIEQSTTNTEANNSLIDIAGGTCTVTGARILANQIQASASTGSPKLIRIATSSDTVIDGNKLATPTDYVPVVITAGSTGAKLAPGNTFTGMTTRVTDSGIGSIVVMPQTVSAPLAINAVGNVSCPTCVLISGTAHGDSAYSILSTDRYVYTNAAFTAARTWTLPAANSLSAGTTIWVQDAQGTVTSTNTLTISRAGADTINVGGTSVVMTGAGGGTQFTTDGVSNWGTAVQTVSTGGTGRQTLTNHGLLVGAGTNPLTQLGVAANGTLLLGQTGLDPVFNTMSGDGTISAAGVLTVTKINAVDETTAWSQTTPTPTCGAGTFTTVSSTLRIKSLGKTQFIALKITITTNGTCATNIHVALPFTPASDTNLTCRENAASGKMASGVIAVAGGPDVQIQNYDNTYPGANGSVIVCGGTAEST